MGPESQPAMRYGNFTLHPVLTRITAAEAAEVRDMWVAEGVLPAAEATRRTREVLFLIREASSGTLAGVCTVYQAPLGETGRTYWHFRMFLRPAFRGSAGLGLPKFVLLASYRLLRESSPPFAPGTRGVVIVAENPVLRIPRVQKFFARQQPPWTFFGFDVRGNDIFYCDFDL
jgi:hypothetical protein